MAKLENIKLKVTLEKYAFICIPFGSYTKIDDVELVTIFGIPVYRKYGDTSKLLWFKPQVK